MGCAIWYCLYNLKNVKNTHGGKVTLISTSSAVKEHHLFCDHSSGFDDFSILASSNNDFKVTLMESLLINRDHPPLNKNRHSLPLELFDD